MDKTAPLNFLYRNEYEINFVMVRLVFDFVSTPEIENPFEIHKMTLMFVGFEEDFLLLNMQICNPFVENK